MKALCWWIFAVTVVVGLISLFWLGGSSSLPMTLLIATIVLFFVGAWLKNGGKETIARWVFAFSFTAITALAYWGITLLPQGTIFGRQGAVLFFWVEMIFFGNEWLMSRMCRSCKSDGIWS